MVDAAISGPNGVLEAEAGGTRVTGELMKFPAGPGDVPHGKVYIGPAYDYYGSSHEGAGGRLYDQGTLGAIAPGTGANEVVMHGPRHTDWDGGPRAKVEPSEGNILVESSYDDRGGWVVYDLRETSAVNPSHSGDYREVDAHSTLGGAMGDLGF